MKLPIFALVLLCIIKRLSLKHLLFVIDLSFDLSVPIKRLNSVL